jgi:general secretion pathway protein F
VQYRLKVLDSSMVVSEVMIDAASEAEARQLVTSAGGQVVALRAAAGWTRRGGADDFRLAVFNQQLHSLLDAGQSLVEAIDVLGGHDRKPRNRAIYAALLRELRQGRQLSDAMASLPSVFPGLYVAMVRASETTGTIRAAINRYMQYQRQVDEIRARVAAAATYPAILLGVGLLVITFLMLYVLPRFSAVYEDAGTMRNGDAGFVRWWGALVRENELLVWGGTALLVVAAVIVVLHPAIRGLVYRRLIATPWVGERIQILQYGRLYRTLSMLLHSGVSILAALRMTRASLPQAMHDDLNRATKMVGEGIALSVALRDCSLGTDVAVRLLVAGESSGNLGDMMGRIADFYDQETAIWIDTAGRLLEPALMLAIGLVVGGIVLMLYSPIFDLANIV